MAVQCRRYALLWRWIALRRSRTGGLTTGLAPNGSNWAFLSGARRKTETHFLARSRHVAERTGTDRTLSSNQHIAAGLYLFTSNKLEILADHLADRLRLPLSSPLQPETIVVRNKGMERWLKQELARRHSVCANARFPFSEAFGQHIFRTLFPDSPTQSPLERETLSWRIMGALPHLLGRDEFAPLRHYLDGAADDCKLVQLAVKIANLFDQYLVFRPDMIAAWDNGAGTDWQPLLWREVATSFKEQHAAALWRKAAALLKAKQPETTHAFPERLSIFGVSALPPFYLDLFAGLSQHSQVNLFLLQPSQEYWGDITSAREGERILRQQKIPDSEAFQLHLETGNRLLASMGYLGRDFLKLLLDAGDWISQEDFAEPGEASLLHSVQSDILHLRDRGKHEDFPPLEIQPSDTSVEIHSCHSPLREMEALQDQMLDWFQRDPSLAPRDIVVMTPDIETYAPFVQAVFGSPEDDARSIPFNVADRGARRQSQVIDTFLRFLDLPNTRLGAATVLGLLETPAVRERFALTEPDLVLARNWIEETNIRWGIDASHRERLSLPKIAGNTWRDGLNRLLLGYSIAGRGEHIFQNILPYDDIEGESANVLGRFATFVEKLFTTVESLDATRLLDEWATTFAALLNDFFAPSEDAAAELQSIRDALAALRRQHALSGFNAPVSLAVIIERLRPTLEEDIYNSGFLTGGVTFCGLKPMRSIPFKIVCLVGMNDNTFPRPTHQLSFDLMARKPRLGDRSTREDDRYLFLETILSARDRLYLSYVGQSIRDNSDAPPSVLISELLDYVSQGFRLPAVNAPNDPVTIPERLVTTHRLQAFSAEYFTADSRLFSYSQENCRASDSVRQARQKPKPFLATPLEDSEPESHDVTLEDLIRFFTNPARFFLNRRLQIFLPETNEELSEREPFVLDGLNRYQLRQQLVERDLKGASPTEIANIETATGQLPLGAVGTMDFKRTNEAVDAFLQRLAPHLSSSSVEPLNLDLTLGDFHLAGTITSRNAHGPLVYRCARIKATDILRAWITHLAAAVANPAAITTLVGEDTTFTYAAPPNASEILSGLLGLCRAGQRTPLKFFPAAAFAFAEADLKNASASRSSKTSAPPILKALAAWEGNEFQERKGEKGDPHFTLCFRDAEPLDEEFIALARKVFGPILANQTEVPA